MQGYELEVLKGFGKLLTKTKAICCEINRDYTYDNNALVKEIDYYLKNYNLIRPSQAIQKNSVNKAIKFVKMGNVRAAEKAIKPAINYLMTMKCKKIILGCTELPIAIFAFKSFKNIKTSKIFLDPNLILAHAAMKKYKK